jgi:hypothetical protein
LTRVTTVSTKGGSSTPGQNTLTVSKSTFTENVARGGNNNHGTASVSGLVGSGAGAGIANYAGGTATVTDSTLKDNEASGGRHNTGSGTAVFASLGAGGAIFNYLGKYNSPPATSARSTPASSTSATRSSRTTRPKGATAATARGAASPTCSPPPPR